MSINGKKAEMWKATVITLSPEERRKLTIVARSAVAPVREAQRAKVILLADEGRTTREIAGQTGLSMNTVSRWRCRFAQERLKGLEDRPGRGRQHTYGPEAVEALVEATLMTKPNNATHWSVRTMAQETGLSRATVQRIWSAHKIKPHLVRTFKLSHEPHFVEKVHDIVGLYLNPPEHALVLSVDEKSGTQALDRSQPGLPLKKGRCGTMTHDYRRCGTTTLFAALEMAEGKVIHQCMKRHRHQEFLKFLRLIDRSTPKDLDLHLIADNYATHKHANVKEWLAAHPRFHLHFIPTSSSWLSLVERFLRDLTEKRIRRGIFRSVWQLIAAIDAYVEENNAHPKPFVWTKTADEIIKKLAPLYAQRGIIVN
jgi:transposase